MEGAENAIPGPSKMKKALNKKTNATKSDKNLPSTESSEKVKLNPSVLDTVCEAIGTLGVTKKGVSALAIKKFVHSKREIEEGKLNSHINKALLKGIEKGILARPRGQEINGAVGSFVLVKTSKPKNSKKLAAKKQDVEEHVSDSEITIKNSSTQRKRNLSDTATIDFQEKPQIKPPRAKPGKAKIKKKADKEGGQAKIPNTIDGQAKMPNTEDGQAKTKNIANMEDPKAKKVTKKTTTKKTKVTGEKADSSDSEIVVKKASMKSYSSDTELDFVEKDKTVKITERLKKKPKAAAVESKAEKSEPQSKQLKAKGLKKLYNNSDKVEKEETGRTGKTRAKNKT